MPKKKNPKSLANLRQAPPAEKDNGRAMQHGLAAKLPVNMPPEAEALQEVIRAAIPVRGSDGQAHPADEPYIANAARFWAKVNRANDWLDEHSWFGEDGELRPVVAELRKHEDQLTRYLDQLGMTPTSRARLGLDLARTADLATAMSEPDPEKRRAMLADVGLAVDGTAEEVPGE